jgi:hypothetical protein
LPLVACETRERRTIRDWYWALGAFIGVALFGVGAREAIGKIYSSGEAVVLLEALARSGLYLGSASATASATTLALMLTLISLIRQSDSEFNDEAYRNIERIAGLSTTSLFISLLLLLALVLPVGEFEDLPADWYPMLYDGLFAMTVAVVALLAATVMMLYRTVRRVIARITPGEEV